MALPKSSRVASEEESYNFEIKFCRPVRTSVPMVLMFHFTDATPGWLVDLFRTAIIMVDPCVTGNARVAHILNRMINWFDKFYKMSDNEFEFVQKLSILYFESYPNAGPIDGDHAFFDW